MSFSNHIRTGLIRRVALGLAVAAVAAPSAGASAYGPLGQVLASDGQLSHGPTLAAVRAQSAAAERAERPMPIAFRGGFSPTAPMNNAELTWPSTATGVVIGIGAGLI